MRKLPEFALESYFSKWEFTARYHMCASDMESLAVPELLAFAGDDDRQRWDSLRLGYIETFGTPELRDAVADLYDAVESRHVLAFAGAEEGIFAAMQVLLTNDDHAVVITPNYQSAESIPAAVCDTAGVALDYNGAWRLDIDRLFDAVRPNTRVISVNFPHNPTGHIIPPDDFNAIVEFARTRGIYLFSDEVYRLLERDADRRLPQAADVYERGLSLNVLSKSYGLPGLRVGWIATRDTDVLARMERVKHYLSICNAGPSEVLATIALKARNRILARNLALIDDNLVSLGHFFDEFAELFRWSVPDGGCIGFPVYRGADSVETFCERLVNEAGVLLLPASVYRSALGPTPDNHFRIGFGRNGIDDGLGAMRHWLIGR
ncbi:MAG: aminotransferase class I/II-fold pyridoxal phosphate-dependent enzyme [Pseudomonadota bacterium]